MAHIILAIIVGYIVLAVFSEATGLAVLTMEMKDGTPYSKRAIKQTVLMHLTIIWAVVAIYIIVVYFVNTVTGKPLAPERDTMPVDDIFHDHEFQAHN